MNATGKLVTGASGVIFRGPFGWRNEIEPDMSQNPIYFFKTSREVIQLAVIDVCPRSFFFAH